jgi:hypothetical protein
LNLEDFRFERFPQSFTARIAQVVQAANKLRLKAARLILSAALAAR